MKMVWMLHDIVLSEEIQDILDKLGVIGMTRWPRLAGRGPKSGARMDNHVWPGANSAVFVVVEEDVAVRLMGRLQALRDEVGSMTGLWAFTTPVLDMLK